jgi:hypothetical protein
MSAAPEVLVVTSANALRMHFIPHNEIRSGEADPAL